MDNNLRCKISDFGLSKVSTEGTMTQNIGTMLYIAPEMFNNTDSNEISEKLDVFSFSIIMYELLFEVVPYLTFSSKKIYHFRSAPNVNQETAAFTIPSKVAKGIRPVIPFINDEELELWVQEHVYPSQKSTNSLQACVSIISKYVSLMQKCWSQTPSERPSFSSVLQELSNLQSL